MSAKLKIPSSASTLAKVKLSDGSSASVSPVKSNKYKNFLAAVLTPSQTKKWIKRNKSTKSQSSKISKNEAEKLYKDSPASDEFNEPGYSTIQDLGLNRSYHQKSGIESASLLSTKLSDQNIESSSLHLSYDCSEENYAATASAEPVYASVNKQKKNKHKDSTATEMLNLSVVQGSNEKNSCKHLPPMKTRGEKEDSSYKLIEEQKEEIKLLVERLKELTVENRELHKNIETILREEKWRENSLHAELKLKISQLEADTYKEVKCLSEQIQTLQEERKVLTEQIQSMHEEKKHLQLKYDDMYKKATAMVSPGFLTKKMDEHQKLLNQIRKKHTEEVTNLQHENDVLLESNILMTSDMEDLKGKLKTLTLQNETLKHSEQELLQEKSRVLLQLEESKQMQQEAQNMLLVLLKITENICMERDILFNKSSYHDHQQKLLKTSIMDYSMNMGRLQEHISNLSKEKLEELQKLKTGESLRDLNLKNLYGRQVDLLRSKVMNQSHTISDLESEKGKLESQLESLWKVACGKPKLLEDLKLDTS